MAQHKFDEKANQYGFRYITSRLVRFDEWQRSGFEPGTLVSWWCNDAGVNIRVKDTRTGRVEALRKMFAASRS